MKAKPPIGIKPRNLWIEKRISVILDAMFRYEEAKLEYPKEWVIELDWLKALIK